MSDKFFDAIEKAAEKHAEALFGDRTWPDAAFMVEHGAKKDANGDTLQAYRHLVHHNKNAKDPNENSTVDLPHLRNALARANQVQPVVEDKAGFQKRSMAHLQKHARALLKTHQKSPAQLTEVQALCAEFNITVENESNKVDAAAKVVKNGPTKTPYCVIANGHNFGCYITIEEAKKRADQVDNFVK